MQAFFDNFSEAIPAKVTQGMDARILAEPRRLEEFASQLRSLLGRSASLGVPAGDVTAAAAPVEPLCNRLLHLLDLRFVFARLGATAEPARRDVVGIHHRYGDRIPPGALAAVLEPWLSRRPDVGSSFRYPPIGPEVLSVTVLEFGPRSAPGTLIVGTPRPAFPDDLEELLLQVAADQLSIARLHDTRPDCNARDNVVAELRSLARLHRFSTGLIEAGDLPTVMEQMLVAAIEVQGADFGNVQLFDAELGGLVIVAQRNFERPFLDHFALVRREDCACGLAAVTRRRVIIEDVETDPAFAPLRRIAAEAGFRAVQSTPLIGHSGELLGMLSTHFRAPHRPSQHELRLTDIYAQQAARMLERERNEKERSKLAAELAHAGRVLSMGELAASLAHEINQPLAAIVANANASRRWLERKAPNHERARESLDNIARDGMRASDIIRRVRAFSAKGVRNRAPLNVNNVIREVVALTTHELAREHVGLRTQLAEDLPAVLADRIELQQVVLNLVINSIEALRTVVDRPKDLCITSARHDKGMVAISMRDNGNGIEAQHLERIFDPFFTTKSHGMGLGLAISRRIVETHAGALWATPNPECGMTLAFTLPIARRRSRKREPV